MKLLKLNKRVILVGPTAAGKNHLRLAFTKIGYSPDISYTSRTPRENEVHGVDYKFISKNEFEKRIGDLLFYEWVEYNENYYGTGIYEWENIDIFIMETDGVKKITRTDRKDCLVIFVDTPLDVRIERMKVRRWSEEKIKERIEVDTQKFKNFIDFDVKISS